MKRLKQRIKQWAWRRYHTDVIRHTRNFDNVTWLGQPIWQNILDLWIIQEAISEVKPALLIETGTNRGGAALFYANLFDLMGRGEVLTVDIEKLHQLDHPRVTPLTASSVAPSTLDAIRQRVDAADGAVMVILDSDHAEAHVKAELEAYHEFVSPGSLMLVQDGVIDVLPHFEGDRPGPLGAIRSFLESHRGFTPEPARNTRFLITHHPSGWLRRDVDGATID